MSAVHFLDHFQHGLQGLIGKREGVVHDLSLLGIVLCRRFLVWGRYRVVGLYKSYPIYFVLLIRAVSLRGSSARTAEVVIDRVDDTVTVIANPLSLFPFFTGRLPVPARLTVQELLELEFVGARTVAFPHLLGLLRLVLVGGTSTGEGVVLVHDRNLLVLVV